LTSIPAFTQHPSFVATMNRIGSDLLVTAPSGNNQLLFFNIKGKIIHFQAIQNTNTHVSLSPLAGNGVVFARLISENGNVLAQKKLVMP